MPIQEHAVGRYLEKHLNDYEQHVEINKKLMKKNLKRFSEAFSKAFGWKLIPPKGSIYACFLHECHTDMDAVKKALEKGVGVAPGSIFFKGHPVKTGIVRIHLAISEENAEKLVQNLLK